MNAKWLNANTKKCPKCHQGIEKTYGCNWMTCFSCKHGFCWLCMGDFAAHSVGAYGTHGAQCNNLDAVKAKGREQFMVENDYNAAELDTLQNTLKKYE